MFNVPSEVCQTSCGCNVLLLGMSADPDLQRCPTVRLQCASRMHYVLRPTLTLQGSLPEVCANLNQTADNCHREKKSWLHVTGDGRGNPQPCHSARPYVHEALKLHDGVSYKTNSTLSDDTGIYGSLYCFE